MTIKRVTQLLLVIMLFLGSLSFWTPALADETSVEVELTSVTPTVLRITGDLEISGKVTNLGTQPLTGLTVRLWRHRAPITNLDALNIALESGPDAFLGGFLPREPRANFYFDSPLQPGETREFTVSATNEGSDDPLLLTSTGVGYLVGVKITQGNGNATLGSARTLIGSLIPDEVASAVVVAYLTSAPTLLADGSGFLNDSLIGELKDRLEKLLQLAELPGVTTIIDPALFEEISALANGVSVVGKPAQSGDQLLAQRWLQRLHTIITAGNVYRTWYGSPDLVSAFSLERQGILPDAEAVIPPAELVALPLAGWTNESINEEIADFLSQSEADLIFAGGLGGNATVQDFKSQIFVSAPVGQFDGGPGPEPSSTKPHLGGRIAAQQLITNALGYDSVVVADEEIEAEVLLQTADWRKIVSLPSSLETESVSAWFGGTPSQPGRTAETVNLLDDLHYSLEIWSDLTNTPAEFDSVFVRAWNSRWPDDEQAIAWLRQSLAPQLDALNSGKIEIHTSPNWVLSSENNDLPLTITNTKTMPVTVRVVFESQNPSRIKIPQTELVEIPAGESATLRVKPESAGNGTVAITAKLVSSQGREVGEPVQLQVSTNSAGRAGWIIILASGVVLLAGTVLRVRKVRQSRTETPTDDTEAPTDE